MTGAAKLYCRNCGHRVNFQRKKSTYKRLYHYRTSNHGSSKYRVSCFECRCENPETG